MPSKLLFPNKLSTIVWLGICPMKYKPIREHHTIDSINRAQSSMRSFKWLLKESGFRQFRGSSAYLGIRLVIGTQQKMEQLLFESEDSSTINTSFIERLNLTILQGCAYLGRRTAWHSKYKNLLENKLALQRCYYNFVHPPSALKFGDEIRTPAMQSGLTKKQLSFREIFMAVVIFFWWFFMFMRSRVCVKRFLWFSAQ